MISKRCGSFELNRPEKMDISPIHFFGKPYWINKAGKFPKPAKLF
jgi:hypothetical protein